MKSFVAIDVETANYNPTSICSIGAVKVVDGVVVARFHEYVKPEPNWYVRRFSEEIHGISRRQTDSARIFCDVWPDVEAFAEGLPFVAHNKAFDEKCIRECHRCYGMTYPDYPFYCTLQAARRSIPRGICPSYSLPRLCEFFAIPFYNHHDALADAEACARIAMAIL